MSRKPQLRTWTITRRSPSVWEVILINGAAGLLTGHTVAQVIQEPSKANIVAAICATMFFVLRMAYYDRLEDIRILGDMVTDVVQEDVESVNRKTWQKITVARRKDPS